jgi:hypothetical protein
VQLARCGDHRGVDGDERQHEEQRREQAAGPAGPEAAETDRAGVRDLDEQQRRDQVAGEDEEQVDAEVAAVELAAVEEQDGDDRGAADAVERAPVRQPSGRGGGIRVSRGARRGTIGDLTGDPPTVVGGRRPTARLSGGRGR